MPGTFLMRRYYACESEPVKMEKGLKSSLLEPMQSRFFLPVEIDASVLPDGLSKLPAAILELLMRSAR